MNQLPQLARAFANGEFPFLELLGVKPISLDHSKAELRMAVDDRHLRAGGIVHGGVLATLLDTAVGMAAATLTESGTDLVTIQLNMNFIRTARVNDQLTASGQVNHKGRTTAVAEARVVNQDDVLVATASGTVMILQPV